jgi:hypothetical protein
MAKSVLECSRSALRDTNADLIHKSEILRRASQELRMRQKSITRMCEAEIARSRKLLEAAVRTSGRR